MKVVFSGKAEDQLRDIQAAFREVSQDLASSFAKEVQSAVWRLEQFPFSGRQFAGVRRVVLLHSRFVMLYHLSNDHVYVTKFVHQKQAPDY